MVKRSGQKFGQDATEECAEIPGPDEAAQAPGRFSNCDIVPFHLLTLEESKDISIC